MHKLKKYIFFFSFFIFSRVAAAEPAFEFVWQDKTIPATVVLTNSWQQATRLPSASVALYSPFTLNELSSPSLTAKTQDLKTDAFTEYSFNPGMIYNFLQESLPQIEQEVVEPQIELNLEKTKVLKFTPPKNGARLNLRDSALVGARALADKKLQSELVVDEQQTHKKLSETNDLGINELLASGHSAFSGSPKNRRHNIKIGVEKFSGIILAPGEIFSFNKFLGPVEEEQGFLPELVIKKDGTQPELGGGLCQVSSTAFRAAVNAGLPILQRKNHAYAVQYYKPQGTDATIYPGVVDFKFLNDTSGSVLVWPYFTDADNLVFDFYGTKDDRLVTVYKPVQYDLKTDGSLKANWVREVTKNNITKKDEFKSVYLPPALFHKEEKFVSASGTQASLGSPSIN